MAELDALPCAVLVTDLQGWALFANAELLQKFGARPPEAGVWHLDDLLPPASRIFMQTHVWPLLHREGRVSEIHLKMHGREGVQQPVLLNARCHAPTAADSSRVHWVFLLATERQRFEAELLQTRQRLQNLLLSSNAGTWEWHVPSGRLQVNERWRHILGLHDQDGSVIDWAFRSESIHAEDLARSEAKMIDLREARQPEYVCELRMRKGQRDWVWVEERGRLISRMPDGRPEWIFGTLIDTSSSMAQRAALRRSEMLLKRTNELAGVGGWELDLRTQSLYWSAQTCRIHGVPIDHQPTMKEALNFYPVDARSKIKSAARSSIQEGSGWDLELPFIDVTGRARMIRAIGSVEQEQGQPVRLVGAIQDVTEAHQIVETLRQAKRAAEAASEAKSMFLANMSHEIRTPMNAVIGIAHLLADSPLNADQSQLLGKLQIAGRSLLSLIDDVLDLAKIEAGEMSVENAVYNLDDLLHRLDALFSAQLRAKGLRWTVQRDANVPETLVGDVTRLHQVLSNLLSNALKFTASGEVRLIVSVLGSELRFAVMDSGIGIGEAAREKLFQPFVQEDVSTTRRFGGTGLGLFISRQMVILMGGRLDLQSKPGQGSEFIIHLPLQHAVGSVPEMKAHRSERPLQGLHLLAVDDSEINLEVVRRMLEQAGATVETERSGEAALERMQAGGHFDAVLMDVQMPGMDGLEATLRIRQLPGLAGLPVIALTAGALANERHRAMAVGMSGFLTKPIDPGKLVQEIRGLVGVRTDVPEVRPPPAISAEPETAKAGGPVLDLNDALPRLGGDMKLLKRLLSRLLVQHDATWLTTIEAKSASQAKMELHRLRGTASNLGVNSVAERAARAEALLAQNASMPAVLPLLDDLGQALAELRHASADLLVEDPAAAHNVTSDLVSDGASRYSRLLRQLEGQELDAAEELEALKPWLLTQGFPRGELEQVVSWVADLDFRPAWNLLNEWRPCSD